MERINLYANNEIKFNLLAVIPDKKMNLIEQKENKIKRKNYICMLLNKEEKSQFNMEGVIIFILIQFFFKITYS